MKTLHPLDMKNHRSNHGSTIAEPFMKDLVLVGGGHAHVHVIKMCGMPPLRQILVSKGIQVTLISDTILTPYSGMLPGYIANHYTWEEIHIDLSRLCRFSNVRFLHTAAVGIRQVDEHSEGFVLCSDGRPPVRYDVLSLDIGITPAAVPSISGNATLATTPSIVTAVKPISGFADRYAQVRDRLKTEAQKFNVKNPFILAVVGGGAGGVEIALSSHFNMTKILEEKNADAKAVKIVLVSRGKELLETHNKKVQKILNRILKERGIELRLEAEVIGIKQVQSASEQILENVAPDTACSSISLQDKYCFILSDKSMSQPSIDFHECLWCTSAGAPSWITQETPVETSSSGFILVHNTYQSTSHKNIFAAGDCCEMVNHLRPKAGVFAVRAGPPLTKNLIAQLLSLPLRKYIPQVSFLGLISTGDKYAVASKGRWAMEGRFLWNLKDMIDRTFMKKYSKLPKMAEAESSHNTAKNDSLKRGGDEDSFFFSTSTMRCGGCGAKVGSTVVARVLNDVRKRSATKKRYVANSPNSTSTMAQNVEYDDAAIVMLPSKGGGALVETVDFFRSFIPDPFIFGQIAAVHAMSDCCAMGVDPQTALALAVIPYSAEDAITEATLTAMLAGACDALEQDGCQLVGGHTSEGAELALGFSITGFIDTPSSLFRKKGGQVGDKIVLTKSIGTGAVFAADMRAECQGKHVAQALSNMIKSNQPASRIARKFSQHIRACTDVTGYGLVGHLLEMLVANDGDNRLPSIGALLHLNQIPFLDGAIEASSKGIVSSLFQDNFRSKKAISNHEDAAQNAKILYPLIFDPQTAGGLLFFVSPDVCDKFLSVLKQEEGGNNTAAAIIGEVVDFKESELETVDYCTIGGGGENICRRLTVCF